METKRCPDCHKLLRADSQTCSRCSHSFVQKKPKTTGATFTKPSIPPASPHRAGHYSGLHPEDQPYQSTIHQASNQESGPWYVPAQEPGEIILPSIATPSHLEIEKQPTYPTMDREIDMYRAPKLSLKIPSSPYKTRKPLLSRRIIRIILTISGLLFLLAGSLITIALIRNHTSITIASVQASPDTGLRVHDQFTLSGHGFGPHNLLTFNYDINKTILGESGSPLEAHADNNGNLQIQISVGDNWGLGPHLIHVTDEAQKLSVSTSITIQPSLATAPQLQLPTATSNLGAAASGVVSSKPLTLTNSGGSDLSWQESSDQAWLTVSPNSGTFSGRQNVLIFANRGTLTPQSYIGHITFTQQVGAPPLTLTVTMTVTPAPAALSIFPTALTYSATTTQNPASQTITILNSGRQPLDWASTVSTGDGSPWLSITPAHSHLDPYTSIKVTVNIQSQILLIGSYQGTISFSGGANAHVNITCTVVTPGSLVVSPPSLTFSALTGQQNLSQVITLQNSSDQPLSWTSTVASQNNWLHITPSTGQLDPGAQISVTVTIDATALKPGPYQGTFTITSGDNIQVPTVSLTVAPSSASAVPITYQGWMFGVIV